jgi:hypothetical protein
VASTSSPKIRSLTARSITTGAVIWFWMTAVANTNKSPIHRMPKARFLRVSCTTRRTRNVPVNLHANLRKSLTGKPSQSSHSNLLLLANLSLDSAASTSCSTRSRTHRKTTTRSASTSSMPPKTLFASAPTRVSMRPPTSSFTLAHFSASTWKLFLVLWTMPRCAFLTTAIAGTAIMGTAKLASTMLGSARLTVGLTARRDAIMRYFEGMGLEDLFGNVQCKVIRLLY